MVSGFRRARREPAHRTDYNKRSCSKDGVLEECSGPCNPEKRTPLESTVGLLRDRGGVLQPLVVRYLSLL